MKTFARSFAVSEGGNFAIMASILAVPLVVAAGVAMDLSTLSRTRSELQNAMDSAVLAVAREGKEIDDNQAKQIALTFVSSNYHLQYTDLDIVRDEPRKIPGGPAAALNNSFGFGGHNVSVAFERAL